MEGKNRHSDRTRKRESEYNQRLKKKKEGEERILRQNENLCIQYERVLEKDE
jgi:hypothetical protein